MKGASIAAALAALPHGETLETPTTSSDAPEADARRRRGLIGLGWRRADVFAGMRVRELAAIADAPARGPEELAARGRARRFRGRLDEARADLREAVRAGSETARGWLAESYSDSEPSRALRLLDGVRVPGSACWRAWALWATGRVVPALREIEREPGGHLRLILRAALLDRRGDAPAAERAAELAERDDPASPFGPSLRGEIAARRGDLERALVHYQRARDLDVSVSGRAIFERMGVRLEWRDHAEGAALLDDAVRRWPKSALLRAERAEILGHPSLCRYADAFGDYERAAALEPTSGRYAALLGRARTMRDGAEAGMPHFDRAAALAPSSGWILSWRGAALARLGRSREALADFDAAEARMPWYPFVYAWRGALLRKLGRAARATEDLDRALALDPTYAFSWNERFQARLEAGDPEGAAEDLRRAHALDPKYTWSAVRGKRASRELDAAARARPRSPWIRVWRGQARLESGRPKLAVDDLSAAARRLPKETAVASWLGRALAADGRTAAARRILRGAVRADPTSWAARKALADLCSAQGRWREALPHLRRAAELAPTTVALLMEYAAAASRLGRDDDALAAWEKAARLDPRYPDARAAVARARLTRASKRQAAGDFAGQAEDFRAALSVAPEMFPAKERRRLSALLGGNGGRA